ncbi:MAG: nitroreductase family protein, partial [Lentisphaerae bacterium]|nr:nitroreductase family protein [Lentisphaerota bacterium]
LLRNVRYNLIDLGIAGEHLVLQAAAEGLGTCWIGWFNERGVRRALDLPRGSRVELLISMGYPASDQLPPKSRKPLDEIREYR